jgi:hypothetical protein
MTFTQILQKSPRQKARLEETEWMPPRGGHRLMRRQNPQTGKWEHRAVKQKDAMQWKNLGDRYEANGGGHNWKIVRVDSMFRLMQDGRPFGGRYRTSRAAKRYVLTWMKAGK